MIIPMLGGKFARIDYTWEIDGEPQAGSLLFGYESKAGLVTAVFIDSWHNGEVMMVCKGSAGADGALSVSGFYPAPSGPDWGWRTVIEPGDNESFRPLMYNITPQGHEELAVEARYTRVM